MKQKKEDTSVRLPLTISEKQTLEFVLERVFRSGLLKSKKEKKDIENIIKKIPELKYLHLENKRTATKNANLAKKNTSLKKIENAINLLRMENKKITPYFVAETANISYNTARKYMKEMKF